MRIDMHTNHNDSATCILFSAWMSAAEHLGGYRDTYSMRSDCSISIALLTNCRSFSMLTRRPARFSPSMFIIKTIPDMNKYPYSQPTRR